MQLVSALSDAFDVLHTINIPRRIKMIIFVVFILCFSQSHADDIQSL